MADMHRFVNMAIANFNPIHQNNQAESEKCITTNRFLNKYGLFSIGALKGGIQSVYLEIFSYFWITKKLKKLEEPLNRNMIVYCIV